MCMEDEKELAKYIIDLKIAKEIKENKEKDFEAFTQKITKLKNERNEIYKDNQEIINKILTEYVNEIK